ncbi:hypothetical protein EGW08_002994 [Elysia chlorotica]|uniref:GOLD domain-containing protein n=1 Tax=Elysia chlorotica TaxID=188477 RepID=A0A3S1BIQ7_ELYCH|nr:hypothetical protein EGW08_002994 [Elysia chlorotica]
MANSNKNTLARFITFGHQATGTQQMNRLSIKNLSVVFYLTILTLVVTSPVVKGENVMGVEDDEFDFDGLPGAQHDFKVYVHAGMEECFFQKVAQGAEFYARFEVLKGGDKIVDFYIRDYTGQVINQTTGKDGFFSLHNVTGGTMALCIDNVFDRYGYKVVYVYMVSIIMQEWFKYQNELENIKILASNFSESLTSVESSIVQMRSSQTKARFFVVRDWYMALGNRYYVGMWSMLQCGLIIVAAIAQVFALRRLFRTTTTTPSMKPRA